MQKSKSKEDYLPMVRGYVPSEGCGENNETDGYQDMVRGLVLREGCDENKSSRRDHTSS